MSDFIGFDQERAIVAHLRQELTKDVLEAAAPRFLGSVLQVGGGYGLDFTGLSKYLPYTFVNDVHSAEGVPLCPVLDEGQWVDFESGEAIDDDAKIDPFVDSELRDSPEVAEVRNGAGFLVVEGFDVDDAETSASGLGRRAELRMASPVEIRINVPSGRGKGQLNLYTGILATVLSELLLNVNEFADLKFSAPVPQLVRMESTSSSWLSATWTAQATRNYRPPTGRGIPT